MRLGILLIISFFFVLAQDYSACQRYYKDASETIQQSKVIQVEYNHQKIYIGFFRQKPNNLNLIKADPFVGLYAFKIPSKEEKQSYMIMPIDKRAMDLNMVAIGNKTLEQGIILEAQKGFLEYAKFTANIPQNGVISNICYQIYGIGVKENQFIDSKYLNRFLSQKTPYYGDIGIRLYPQTPKDQRFRVEFVDPFFPNVPFLKDDEILSINNHTFKDYYDFEWYVSNLEENSTANVKIKRKEKTLEFKVIVAPRYGGFLLPDRFFERIGIILNDKFEITYANPQFKEMQQGLLEGDVILWINGERIFFYNTQKQNTQEAQRRLRSLLTDAVSKGKLDVLISRQGFQFTLNLINGLNNEYIKARYDPFKF